MHGGTLEVEMSGPQSTQHDALSIEGDATISGGMILFKFVDGYAPQAGTQIDFLDATGESTIENVTLAFEGVADGFDLQVNSDGKNLTFQANTDAMLDQPSGLCGQGLLGMVPLLLFNLLTLKYWASGEKVSGVETGT